MERIDLYIQQGIGDYYKNTEREGILLNKFEALYSMAKSARDECEEVKSENLDKWRRAYLGTLNALKQDGSESEKKSRQVRKLAYEVVESTVDNSIPLPKLIPHYKKDVPLINITENYLKYEVNRAITKRVNDENERATYIDGTSWLKVSWDSLDSTYERSGDIRIEHRTVDQIVPQPGISDYKRLEYIFEVTQVSVTELYDLYGRFILPGKNNMCEVVACYYLNEHRVVGLFMWAKQSGQVICNEKDWQIRKLRHCTKCDAIVPVGDICPVCQAKSFKYKNAEVELLSEDILTVFNPYEITDVNDVPNDARVEEVEVEPGKTQEVGVSTFAKAGTEIPFYRISQLPFVPRPCVSKVNSIYGISQVRMLLEQQDGANKALTKAIDKTMKSGAVITKPEKVKLNDKDETFKILAVRSHEEAQQVQTKQIIADTSQDLAIAAMLYDSAKSSSGITDSFQGKRDTTATSGIAKQYQVAQSAGRIESTRIMKSAAYAGIYELVLKYLLAFSDKKRTFIKVLPDGTEQEQEWSKYMFLAKDSDGNIYYRDDFEFNSDPAATLSEDRQAMWSETVNNFIQGTFGNPADSRTLVLFWNIMAEHGYPLARSVLAGIKDNSKHIPAEMEQAILSNPQIMQAIQTMLQEGQGPGGARPNSGPEGNGATHSANVERTNARNANIVQNSKQPVRSAQQSTQGGSM